MNFLPELTACSFKATVRTAKKDRVAKVVAVLDKEQALGICGALDESWPGVLQREADAAPVVLKPGDKWDNQVLVVKGAPTHEQALLQAPVSVTGFQARPDPDNKKAEDEPEDNLRLSFTLTFAENGEPNANLAGTLDRLLWKGELVHVQLVEDSDPQERID